MVRLRRGEGQDCAHPSGVGGAQDSKGRRSAGAPVMPGGFCLRQQALIAVPALSCVCGQVRHSWDLSKIVNMKINLNIQH